MTRPDPPMRFRRTSHPLFPSAHPPNIGIEMARFSAGYRANLSLNERLSRRVTTCELVSWPDSSVSRRWRPRARNLDRAFQRVRESADLPPELTMYALRHSYVTHLIEAGYDPLFVQQQVGHSYSSTTALYTSVSSDFKQKTIQRMIARRIVTGDETR